MGGVHAALALSPRPCGAQPLTCGQGWDATAGSTHMHAPAMRPAKAPPGVAARHASRLAWQFPSSYTQVSGGAAVLDHKPCQRPSHLVTCWTGAGQKAHTPPSLASPWCRQHGCARMNACPLFDANNADLSARAPSRPDAGPQGVHEHPSLCFQVRPHPPGQAEICVSGCAVAGALLHGKGWEGSRGSNRAPSIFALVRPWPGRLARGALAERLGTTTPPNASPAPLATVSSSPPPLGVALALARTQGRGHGHLPPSMPPALAPHTLVAGKGWPHIHDMACGVRQDTTGARLVHTHDTHA